MTTTESRIERDFIAKLESLKYAYRAEIRDRASLETNFRRHFQALNRVNLSDSEFERDDGTPLFYTLVNIKDCCKNRYEVVRQQQLHACTITHAILAKHDTATAGRKFNAKDLLPLLQTLAQGREISGLQAYEQ